MAVLQPSAQRLVGCAVAWVVIDFAAVLLRLGAKRMTKTAFSIDDTWCLVALALVTAFNALQIAGQSSIIFSSL